MKVLPFVIPKTEETFMVQVDRQPYFYDILHRHPEIQLTLIINGEGTVIAGDYLGTFKSGNIYLMGHNMPHVFKSDPEYYSNSEKESHAISLFFDERSWLGDFAKLPEAFKLKAFFQDSGRGFQLPAEETGHLSKMIISLPELKGMKRLLRSLNVLHELSVSEKLIPLALSNEEHILTEDEGQRMNHIFQFTLREFHRPVTIAEVADIAHLTTNSFCRYFKKRTRKTYINFLNEIRISKAEKMLLKSELPVAQVGYLCGFNNLSNFNRIFKRIKGISPSEYRKAGKSALMI